jgi:hypothetical protein
VKYGKLATLLVDAKGFQDGRLVVFEIFKQAGSKKDKIAEVNGVVRREKGIGRWQPQFERETQLPLEEKVSQQSQKEQYSFTATIDKNTADEKTVEGTPIEFTYPLSISLKDESDTPIEDVDCTITFSDGSSRKEKVRNGYIKLDNAPSGKFTVKLEDYEFMF